MKFLFLIIFLLSKNVKADDYNMEGLKAVPTPPPFFTPGQAILSSEVNQHLEILHNASPKLVHLLTKPTASSPTVTSSLVSMNLADGTTSNCISITEEGFYEVLAYINFSCVLVSGTTSNTLNMDKVTTCDANISPNTVIMNESCSVYSVNPNHSTELNKSQVVYLKVTEKIQIRGVIGSGMGTASLSVGGAGSKVVIRKIF